MTSTSPNRSLLSRTFARRDGSGSFDVKGSKGPLGLDTVSDSLGHAIADLIFVHGLAGGSRSTWTKSADAALFWPQEWLPVDDGFRNVRIHTFGYSSNLGKGSVLNIHDFAKSLLGAIHDCPTIPQETETPLIFVGHSMGGLVIKKAYVLAQQFAEYKSIADRVRAVIFLATPHRGSDLAALLSKILYAAEARPFVEDLHRNSLATQSTNEEFSHQCQSLQLFSFYETLPMNYIIGKGLVVDKDSAVLGFPPERSAYMDANHRDICKFGAKSDENYIRLRNALASTIEGLRVNQQLTPHELDRDGRKLLDAYLDISEEVEDDYLNVDAQRLDGSCEWLKRKESFQAWLKTTSTARIYWVNAKPASGKTVLSGSIIKCLRDMGFQCGFHFFDHGDRLKASIGYLLRSVAWQLGVQHPDILAKVLEVFEKDEQLAQADYRTLWRKLFLDGILKVHTEQIQYLVIDALDECKSETDLVAMLLKMCELRHIRIFITSRTQYQTYDPLIALKANVAAEKISEKDTKLDIAMYLEAHIDHLPSIDDNHHQSTLSTILEKSAGCFLWVSLVLAELKQVHTAVEVLQVLEDVPSDMDALYSRILQSMSKMTYGKALAKAILTWTVCSARPLSTMELYHALQLDIKDSIDDIEKSIAACCGQLVYVDTKMRVHMVHQTAREFLLRSSIDSEFLLDRKASHKRLATTCIQYLYGSEMKAPRHRKLSLNNVTKPRSAFAAYACSAIAEHINQVSPTDDEVFLELVKFLNSSNILCWIEHLAHLPDLGCIVQTGRSLRHYLQRRSRSVSPFGKDYALIDSWASDLIRLVAKFGKNLLESPASIYNHIPPFCPAESAPRKQFAGVGRGINVLGLSATTWDDCLSTLSFPGETLSALTCGDKYIAAGSTSGRFVIFNQMTCQEVHSLQHQEAVRLLRFGQHECAVASAGIKTIRIWDVGLWHELWHFDIPADCLTMSFTDEDRLFLGALRNNQFMIWNLTTGGLSDCVDWTEDDQGQRNHAFRRPISAALCLESGLLAVVYRGQDILVWDIERNELQDTYGRDAGAEDESRRARNVKSFVTGGLVFSSNPSATLLAASYSDGDLILFDTYRGIAKDKIRANAQALASSPDGRTLAAADSAGTLQLFDFGSLRLLYSVKSDESIIKSLAFSGDNCRILDVRGSDCRIWDPIALLRQDEEEENSDTDSVFTMPQEVTLEASEEEAWVTSVSCHENGSVFFCSKTDGSVYIFNAYSGLEVQKVISHATGVPIVSMFFNSQTEMLSTVDSSSRMMNHKVCKGEQCWEVEKVSNDCRLGVAVQQLLSDKTGTRVLIGSPVKDILCTLALDQDPILRSIENNNGQPHRWLNHPLNQDKLILIKNARAYLYDWQSMEEETHPNEMLLDGYAIDKSSIQSLYSCLHGQYLAATFGGPPGTSSIAKKIFLWRTPELSSPPSSENAPSSQPIFSQVRCIIGAYRERLVFLHTNGWVCSMILTKPVADFHIRHFFLPADWLASTTEVLMDITGNGDIIFVKKAEVAIIKRGLEAGDPRSASAGPRQSETSVKRQLLRVTRSIKSEESSMTSLPQRRRPSIPESRA